MNSSKLTDNSKFEELEQKFAFLRHAREVDKPLNALENSTYCVIDIETTGLDPIKSEIIEIAALKIKDNDIKDIYSTLIQPSGTISAEIEKLTGISDALVSGYPSIKEVLPKFLSFIEGTVLIAHNVDFDVPFIKYWTRMKLEQEITNQTVCTLKLSRALFPGLRSHRLASVAEYLKIPTSILHRALADAEITFQVWQKMQEHLKKRNITTLPDLMKLI
jgi:DNA polymerase III epsilon subunit family exonuclease